MYRVAESVRSTHGQDGAVVLDIRQGQMFNLNLVGSRILELLKTGTIESAIADEIVREFGVSRDLAENDLQAFLNTLSKHRLIEYVDEIEQLTTGIKNGISTTIREPQFHC